MTFKIDSQLVVRELRDAVFYLNTLSNFDIAWLKYLLKATATALPWPELFIVSVVMPGVATTLNAALMSVSGPQKLSPGCTSSSYTSHRAFLAHFSLAGMCP